MHAHYGSIAGASAGIVLIFAIATALPVAAQGKDNLWEYSTKMDMPGMPMAMPAQVHRFCVGKNAKDDDIVPRQENCRMLESKRTGNKFTYKMECTGREPSIIVGDLTFGTNVYEGQMRMTMTRTNDTMNMAVSGKRVGDCTAPAK